MNKKYVTVLLIFKNNLNDKKIMNKLNKLKFYILVLSN